MKKKIIQMLCLSFAILIIACSNATNQNKVIEEAKKSFVEYYKTNPDTCIQMDETHFLFINKVKKEILDSIYFHVFVHKDRKWNPIFSTGLEQYILAPINDVGLYNIQGRDYFYLQYELGGGNMGNNSIDFFAYSLDDSKEYLLSYQYYPLRLSVVSSITPCENLIKGSEVYNFLYEKVRSSDQYKKDEFFQKVESISKIPMVTDEAIAEKTSSYVGESKGDRIVDGLHIRYFIGEDRRYMINDNIYSTSIYATITDEQENFIVNDCFSPLDINPNYKGISHIYVGSADFRKGDDGKFYLIVAVQIAESDSMYDEWKMRIARDGTVAWELIANQDSDEI